jgi:hypothetical protein
VSDYLQLDAKEPSGVSQGPKRQAREAVITVGIVVAFASRGSAPRNATATAVVIILVVLLLLFFLKDAHLHLLLRRSRGAGHAGHVLGVTDLKQITLTYNFVSIGVCLKARLALPYLAVRLRVGLEIDVADVHDRGQRLLGVTG